MGWKLLQQFYRRPELYSSVPTYQHSVYVFLLFSAHDDGTGVFPSVETIAMITNHQPRQARKILSDLEREGWIERISVGRGRGNKPLWHIPLIEGPAGERQITPKPLAASESQAPEPSAADRRGQKPRPVRLVKEEGEPFLDVDQAGRPVTGKEIERYHEAYQGYAPQIPGRPLRLLPQPGVTIEEVPQASEAEKVQVDVFNQTIAVQIDTINAQILEKQERIQALVQGIDKTTFEANKQILRNLKKNAEQQIQQLLTDLAELEGLLPAMEQKRREVL